MDLLKDHIQTRKERAAPRRTPPTPKKKKKISWGHSLCGPRIKVTCRSLSSFSQIPTIHASNSCILQWCCVLIHAIHVWRSWPRTLHFHMGSYAKLVGLAKLAAIWIRVLISDWVKIHAPEYFLKDSRGRPTNRLLSNPKHVTTNGF